MQTRPAVKPERRAERFPELRPGTKQPENIREIIRQALMDPEEEDEDPEDPEEEKDEEYRRHEEI